MRAYLKSLGARNPTRPEALKAGVDSWNDFSEVLVKATVEKAADGLAKMINGQAQLNVYGQSFSPGKRAYVIVRPKGLEWCNVFQVAPPPRRFEDPKKTEAFVTELAKACGAPALMIEYSDTSDAAHGGGAGGGDRRENGRPWLGPRDAGRDGESNGRPGAGLGKKAIGGKR